MEREQLGVAIVGAGTFGAKHAEALACMPTARLIAVGDPDAVRAQRMARCYGVHATSSISDIWQRDDVDGVILTTPTNTHRALTLEAVEAGKHVLVEKPAALKVDDFDAMQQAASAAAVVLMVGQTLRFHKVAQALERAARNGDVGEPVFFNWVHNSTRSWPGGWRGWQTDPARSGGMALHLAIHSIDLAFLLLDSPPDHVYAQGSNLASPGLAVYDLLQIGIRCVSGANALLESHVNLPDERAVYQSASLLGTHGQAQWSLADDGLYIGRGGSRLLFSGYDQCLKNELEHFVECCQHCSDPNVTPDQVRWGLATAAAVNRSLQSGQAIPIRDVLGGDTV